MSRYCTGAKAFVNLGTGSWRCPWIGCGGIWPGATELMSMSGEFARCYSGHVANLPEEELAGVLSGSLFRGPLEGMVLDGSEYHQSRNPGRR